MTTPSISSTPAVKGSSLAVLILLTIVSLVLWNNPTADWILSPVKTFVTTLHELGHALVCVLTGGHVNGLTIVSDNNGHGGLTMTQGGNPFLYTQSGYLGTAFFGCLFIYLGKYRHLSKAVLVFMGLLIAVSDVLFMSGAIFHEGRLIEGALSMLWGLILAALLIWGGLKLNQGMANLLLLFLAVQTALNALTDVGYLFGVSTGFSPGMQTFTDATNMQRLTLLPAWMWSGFWAICSAVMLAFTLWLCYGKKRTATADSGMYWGKS